VWTERDLSRVHADGAKHEKVRRMFAAIAGSYDLNNRVHSLWRDQAWRRYAVRASGLKTGEAVLDVACGTGDLTEAFARAGAGSVVGLDFTQEMLDVAGRKRERLDGAVAGRIRYVNGDAQALPLPDASVDVVSIAFGIRNVADPPKAVREFRRVLRPGGRLVILEFGQPSLAPLRWFNGVYCKRLMPRTATLISGDRSGAYRYLPASVETFLSRPQMEQMMRDAGFEDVASTPLTLGICVCYVGRAVPAAL
jgi:demethylmenaquinone methyltransferase/2-methoxy-6-polyprenyl-1,4-benzoquinol methylase